MYFSIYDESSTLPNEKLTGYCESNESNRKLEHTNASSYIFEYRIYIFLYCLTRRTHIFPHHKGSNIYKWNWCIIFMRERFVNRMCERAWKMWKFITHNVKQFCISSPLDATVCVCVCLCVLKDNSFCSKKNIAE